jgi:hypothetical protein
MPAAIARAALPFVVESDGARLVQPQDGFVEGVRHAHPECHPVREPSRTSTQSPVS